MQVAVFKNDIEVVKLLLARQEIDVNKMVTSTKSIKINEETEKIDKKVEAPLHIAARKGHIEITKLLVNHTGVDVFLRFIILYVYNFFISN